MTGRSSMRHYAASVPTHAVRGCGPEADQGLERTRMLLAELACELTDRRVERLGLLEVD